MPKFEGGHLVEEQSFDFVWSSGFAESQKRKNVAALHDAARQRGLRHVLEISSKSDEEVGRRLSAFSLKIEVEGVEYPLESVYQGSKVFESCGPSSQIYEFTPREAKRFVRELNCGRLIGFEFEGQRYPLSPKNAFYDWLYIRALVKHADWIGKYVSYDGYTDIEFNPEKQVNCQARAFAEYKSLAAKAQLDQAAHDFRYFSSLLPPI
ncbi:hypothetical protein [Roseibium sp.]